jgi:hypothetical protein
MSDPGSLADVLVELQRREPIFHRREFGTTREEFEAMTAPDFWEVGASGQIYSREHVWAVLERRWADPEYGVSDGWTTSDFLCREVAPGAYLLNYTLRQGGRLTRRLTVWRWTGDVWQIVYHQGTQVESD